MIDRRSFLIGSAMGVTGLAGIALQPRPDEPAVPQGTLATLMPERVGGYRSIGAEGVVQPEQTPLTRQLYSDVVTRIYLDSDGEGIMVLAAAGAATGPGLAVHRPEQCYPAAGFEMEGVGSVPLPAPAPAGARAQVVAAVRPDRREIVHYWVRVGRGFPLTAVDQRRALMVENMRGVLPAARLMRISALSTGPSADASTLARIEAFSRGLLGGLSNGARHLLLGTVE